MEFMGSYGDAETLSLKGQKFLHTHDKTMSTYQKAYRAFEEALEIDPENKDALYYIGLMHLLGYGRDQDIPKALSYFEDASQLKDPRAYNALGYIYWNAPETIERDGTKRMRFGSINRDATKAYQMFAKSSGMGNVNAKYNLGSMYLS